MNIEIEKLHRSGVKVYVVATGGGSNIQHLLAIVPGASNTILESRFVYSRPSLDDFLGEKIDKSASEETAVKMANRAFENGVRLVKMEGGDISKVVGLALTAAIATDRKLKGEHRVHIALRSPDELRQLSVVFKKNADGWSASSRETEIVESGHLALNMLLGYVGLEQSTVYAGTMVSDDFVKRSPRTDEVLLKPRITKLETKPSFPRLVEFDGKVSAGETLSPDKHLLFPGSFDPPHPGHRLIAAVAERKTGKQVVYAINAGHPDKGLLEEKVISERVEKFAWNASVLVTSGQKLYLEKAKAYPGFGIVMSAETLIYMLDPRYYEGGKVNEMLDTFASLGTRFYVAGREMKGVKITLDQVLSSVPEKYHELFIDLHVMPAPMSSTEIRTACA